MLKLGEAIVPDLSTLGDRLRRYTGLLGKRPCGCGSWPMIVCVMSQPPRSSPRAPRRAWRRSACHRPRQARVAGAGGGLR